MMKIRRLQPSLIPHHSKYYDASSVNNTTIMLLLNFRTRTILFAFDMASINHSTALPQWLDEPFHEKSTTMLPGLSVDPAQ